MSTLNVIRELKKNKLNNNQNIILPSINLHNTSNVSYITNKNINNFIKNKKNIKNIKNKLNETIDLSINKNYTFEKNNKNLDYKTIKTKNIENQNLNQNNEISEEEFLKDFDNNDDDFSYDTSNEFNTLQVFDLSKIQDFVKKIKENDINDEEDLELFYDDIDTNLSKNLNTIYE